MVLELAEVALAQPVQRGAVELRRAPDEVVHLGLELLARAVEPAVGRDVAVLHEHSRGVPVLGLAGKPVAALQDQHPLAGRRQPVGQRAATRARADDDYVVVVAHVVVLSRTSWSSVVAARSSIEMWGRSASLSPQAIRFGTEEASTVAAWSRSK